MNLVIPDFDKSINQEGIEALGKPRKIWIFGQLEGLAKFLGFTFDTPLNELNDYQLDMLFDGSKEKIPYNYYYGDDKVVEYKHRFSGVFNYLKHYYENTSSNKIREWAEAYMNTLPCSSCSGGRLRKESLSVKIGGKNISEVVSMSILDAREFFLKLKFTKKNKIISEIKRLMDLNLGRYCDWYIGITENPQRTLVHHGIKTHRDLYFCKTAENALTALEIKNHFLRRGVDGTRGNLDIGAQFVYVYKKGSFTFP